MNSRICRLAASVALAIVVGTPAQAQTFTLLHSFAGPPQDGATPFAGVVRDAAGTLYGTTYTGGTFSAGTVYKVNASGLETVLYSFKGGADGCAPSQGELVRDAAGNLYGTAAGCGAPGLGTVFKLDTAGTLTVLFSFTGQTDGGYPHGGVVRDAAGNLYGTALSGGDSSCAAFGCGVVFKLDPTGKETVLYSFKGADGVEPFGDLFRDAAGNVYGMTMGGGAASPGCPSGCGVIFKVDPSGTETTLHSFNGTDGLSPNGSGLVQDAAGNLYGTTSAGGSSNQGVVFKLDPAGNETVLYSFTGAADGGVPTASVVVDPAGNLYGTTQSGGNLACFIGGCGVVFQVDPSGHETVLHTFGWTDGAWGLNMIEDGSGVLYGTTASGGAVLPLSAGTVFRLVPLPSFSLNASAFSPSRISAGSSSTSTVNVAAVGTFNGPVALTCSVQPAPTLAPQCSVSPNSVVPGTAATLTVSTAPPPASLSFKGGPGLLYAVWLPMMGWVVTRVRSASGREKKAKIPATALACVIVSLLFFGMSCAGGSSGGGGGGGRGGTPAGTYSITVTGSSPGAVLQSTTTMLMVE